MNHDNIISKNSSASNALSGKNNHLEHCEDLILTDGKPGVNLLLRVFTNIMNRLALIDNGQNKTVLSAKFDGRPSIVFGYNPENNKFFVGTKSVFNKLTPKIIYSLNDIEKYYSDQPDLADKLSDAFKYLKEVTPKGVYQGDLLFTHDMIKEIEINKLHYLSFTPNTITYVIPNEFYSKLAEQISSAKLGIALHTTYTGKSMKDLKANYRIDLSSFKNSKNVWFKDVYYLDFSKAKILNDDQITEIEDKIKEIKKINDQIDNKVYKNFISADGYDFADIFKIYVNQLVKIDKKLSSPEKTLSDFIKFYTNRKKKEILNLRREKTKKDKENKILDDLKTLSLYKKDVLLILKLYKVIAEVKNKLLNELNDLNNIGTFIEDEKGFKVTAPEGFVAIDHITSSAVKLVDRMNFSRNNFLRQES
jgi:hypothetical protein